MRKHGEKMEYVYLKKLYNKSLFDVNAIEENIQMIFYSVLAFFIPFFLGHPQWIVGIIVNAALILGATYLKRYKLLPVILLPSLGVMTAGLIFGTYTIFLLYLVPFIWLGNAVYAYLFKHLTFMKMNKLLGIVISSLVKAGLLFGVTFVMVSLNVLPALFLTAMGVLQLITALAGGVIAIGMIKGREKFVVRKNN